MLATLLLAGLLVSSTAFAQSEDSSDWPCRQVLIRRISLPAVWSGPSIEGIDWHKDPTRAGLVARLAARRTPIEEAAKAIDELETNAGARKDRELVALFAGLYETLDRERTEVIDGLVRFGRKQRELAETIKAEQSTLRGAAERHVETPEARSAATRLEWNLRIFEERRQALASVCESPALIEQRLFALARAIEQSLD
jgi:hypothetical protein